MDKQSVYHANPFQKTTLPNGLRVTTCEMPLTRSVSVNVYVGVGSRYEPDERAGISHFIEHMLFKGTERRPTPVEISATVEGTGGMINAGTEHEMTVYWCKVAQPHFEESLDLLMDILRNSLFESESIEKERQVVIEELNMINDYPTYRADSLIDELLWPEHAMGREIGGSKQSIGDITREMMLEHLGEYYTPGNVVVSVAGNVRHEDVVRQVGELSEDWPTAEARGWSPVTHTKQAPQLRLEYRKTEQTHLCIGLPGVSIVDPYALDVLSVILGEGMSSRLFVEVREKGGLAYDVHSGVSHFLDCGAFIVAAGVDPSRIYEAVELILAEVGGMRDSVTEDELERAKRLIAGRMMLRMEDTRAVAGWIGNQELLLGHIQDVDEVVERVNAVTLEDLNRVGNQVLVTDKLNMAVVGSCRGVRRLERLMHF